MGNEFYENLDAEAFIARLNQELRNPLTGANRILELFCDGKLGDLTDQQRELLAQILDSNRTVLNNVIRLIDECRDRLTPEEAAAAEGSDELAQSLKRFEKAAKDQGITVEWSLPHGAVVLKTDYKMLRKVFDDLADDIPEEK